MGLTYKLMRLLRYAIALLLVSSVLTGCGSAIKLLDSPLQAFRNTYSAPELLPPLAVPPALASESVPVADSSAVSAVAND